MPNATAGRWLVLAIISSALLMIVIDMTVLYTALPSLTHDLQANASEKLWIVNSYALVVSGLLLGMGTLGDRLGHRQLFIAGLCVFGVASLAAAFSPSPGWLIAARALLGVGAAMMMPATLSIIRLTFEDERERSLAIGIWAAIASGGAAFGPVIGGVLLEHFWWGSVFLINVPIVVLALVLALWLIPIRPGNPARAWDLLGSIQAMVGLIGLAYAIKELSKREPSIEAVVAAAFIGTLALVLFVRRQRRSPQPMVDFSIFRNRVVSAGVAAALVAAAALMGMELVLSQRLQLVLGLSPLEAGLAILPLPLAAFVSGPLTGFMLPRIGNARVLFGALMISGVGMAAYLLVRDDGLASQIASLAVLGAGLGATMTAASSSIMLGAPAEQAGMAASIEEVSYELGGALGVTLMGSLAAVMYSRTMTMADQTLPAKAYGSLDEAYLLADGMSPAAAAALRALARGAFDAGFDLVITVCAALLALTAVIIWLRQRVEARVSSASSAENA
ncbi:MFS transporter [Stutzerimonas azotifigens]|uniref:MFS transporter n=1 Tax=Stutzerimonas azotifigens TaxID=291995 RepID=A0ABR5Z0Y6_9GAMM|nr:MFS transporter [Stutzerimonas azotifigens]MBA1273820.1 MFS transporter [Stutzerimonas azotifigens]